MKTYHSNTLGKVTIPPDWQDWYARDAAAWQQAAARLEADGWTREDHPNRWIKTSFTQGGRRVYLGRPLGCLDWQPRPYPVEVSHG